MKKQGPRQPIHLNQRVVNGFQPRGKKYGYLAASEFDLLDAIIHKYNGRATTMELADVFQLTQDAMQRRVYRLSMIGAVDRNPMQIYDLKSRYCENEVAVTELGRMHYEIALQDIDERNAA